MINYTLPTLLSNVVIEVSPGAFVKRLRDERNGLLIDYDGESCEWIVAIVSDEAVRWVEEKAVLPSDPKDYKFIRIKDDKEWLVFSKGNDRLLIE